MRAALLLSAACLLLLCAACGKEDPADDTGETGPVDADGDGVPQDEDCDDGDPAVGAPAPRWEDADGDGFGDPATARAACPDEPDLVDNAYDCDDTDPSMPLLVDRASGSPTGSGSASDPIDDIATAIAMGPGCVVVGPGTYTGGLTVAQDLILGSLGGAASTTIDAQGTGSVIEVTDGSLTLAGFTLTGGVGSTALGAQTLGGAVQAWNATGLRIEASALVGNQAQYGGGIFGPEKGETIVMDTSFEGNVAETTGGGFYAGSIALDGCVLFGNQATYGGGGYLTAGQGSAVDTSFEGNEATHGGGLYVADEGGFTGGSYSENTAEKGGGVYVDEASGFAGGTIRTNSAERGGGVYLEPGTTLADSIVEDNTASTYGGGVHASGDVTFTDLDLSGNSAASLGGGALLASGAVVFDNLTCRYNQATSSGGGLYLHEATITGTDLTLSENNAEFGAGAALNASEVDVRGGEADIEHNVASVYGGGVHFEGSGAWLGGTFFDNAAEHGAGAFIAGPTVMERVTMQVNVATGNGGGVLANADLELTESTLEGNEAVDGGGMFVAAGKTVRIHGGLVDLNNASGAGGGVRAEGTLESEAVDWATGANDNSPHDVWAGGQAYTWDGEASFVCTGTGGCD